MSLLDRPLNRRAAIFGATLVAGLLAVSSARATAPLAQLSNLELRHASARVGATVDASAAASWQQFEAASGTSWQVTWNEATGLPHRAFAAQFDAAARAEVIPAGLAAGPARESWLDTDSIDRTCRATYGELRAAFPQLPATEDLTVFAIQKAGGVWWAIYQQQAAGVPVEGARADFRLSSDGRLLSLGLSLLPAFDAPASPRLALDDAATAARDELVNAGLASDAVTPAVNLALVEPGRHDREAWLAAGPIVDDHLAWIPIYSADGGAVEPRLVYIVRTEVSEPRARFRSEIDAATGEVLGRENEIYYATISGHADSDTQPVQPTDAYVNLALPDLRITVAGLGQTFTDANGNWSVNSPDPFSHQVTSALTGRWGKIIDVTGPEPSFSANGTPGFPVPVHFSDANSQASERDVYYHMNRIHSWVKAVDPGMTGLDYEVPGNVNYNQTCNAFWDGSSINFYKQGGGCANTGQIADVVLHEYGHGVNQFTFAPAGPSGGQHEGFADFHANTITNQPDIGIGFFGPGSILRTSENNRQYPAPECGGESHCLGEVIAGALWHMRGRLIASLGQGPGVALTDHLFHYAMYGRDSSFEGYYFDLLATDDDNGTLVDGTPHDRDIILAFDQHNIGPGFTLDILHTRHADTEDTIHPYEITAVYSSPLELRADTLSVYYSTGPIGGGITQGPTRVAMSATGDIREYHAYIPAQPLGTEVRYYIKGATSESPILTTLLPSNAPATQFSFKVETDATPPAVVHNALLDKSAAIWPVAVPCSVTDNQAVSSVAVEWKRNGSDQTTFSLARVGDTDAFTGVFNGGVVEGDLIEYRIKASDSALTPNVTYAPGAGFYSFHIVHNFSDNFENGTQDFSHAVTTPSFNDMWHQSAQRNHTSGGSRAWKFGDTGGGLYLDSSDGSLYTPDIHLAAGASLSFWHWISAEEDANFTAWDGAVVELSTNGGTSWAEITPQGGYTHTIIDNPACPFPAGYPCWSGTYNWRQATFDLSSFAFQDVRVRMRFGSDGAVTFEGWYVDDFVLDPGTVAADAPELSGLPSQTALLGNTPNPFTPTTRIRFALAEGTQVSLDIVDVSGRRVRSLVQGALPAGYHVSDWNGKTDRGYEVGAGVYFARLRAGSKELHTKLLKVR